MAEAIRAYRAKDGTIHATEDEAMRRDTEIAAHDVFLCQDYRGPNVHGILNSIVATPQSRSAIKRFIEAHQTEEEKAREKAEAFADYATVVIDRVMNEGAFKIPPMTASATYAFITVFMTRLSNMTHRPDYFEKADRFWAFINANFQIEFSIYAMKAAYTTLYSLPMDFDKQPALKAMYDATVGKCFIHE